MRTEGLELLGDVVVCDSIRHGHRVDSSEAHWGVALRVVLRCRRDGAGAGERALQQQGALVLLVPVLVLELHTCTVTTNGADQRLYTEAITRSDSSVSSLTKNM